MARLPWCVHRLAFMACCCSTLMVYVCALDLYRKELRHLAQCLLRMISRRTRNTKGRQRRNGRMRAFPICSRYCSAKLWSDSPSWKWRTQRRCANIAAYVVYQSMLSHIHMHLRQASLTARVRSVMLCAGEGDGGFGFVDGARRPVHGGAIR